MAQFLAEPQGGGPGAARAAAASLLGGGARLDRDLVRALVETMPDAVVACDPGGAVVLCNRTAREWHGVPPGRPGPEGWPGSAELRCPDGVTALPAGERPLARALGGEFVIDAEAAIAVPGQPVRLVACTGGPMAAADGTRLGAFVVMRDVTEQRRRDADLRRARVELEARVEGRAAEPTVPYATLRGIVDSATAPIFSVDPQYRYTSFNRSHAAVMSALYGAEIAIGESLLECMTVAADREAARRNLDRALAGEAFVEEAFSGEDVRSRQYFRVAHGPIRDDAGRVVGAAVFVADLTERRRAEEALAAEIAERKRADEQLRRMNRQLRAISECNQALMRAADEQAILDEVCRIICERAGYLLAWVGYVEHDAARTIRPVAAAGDDRGYVAGVRATWGDEARGRGPAGTAARTGRTVALQDVAAAAEFAPWIAAASARGFRSVVCLPLADEQRTVFGVLLIYAGQPAAFSPEELQLLEELAGDLAFGITVLRGRARHREAERDVALLSFALNNVHEAAYLADADGKFRYVNDEACRVLGYSRADLLGRGVTDIDPDFPPERWAAHWAELVQRRTIVFETRHRAREGRVFPVEVSANYFEYEGRGYNLALAHDVSERRRLEEQLRQAQKMEAVGTLAGGVAHDFNNILTGIIGYGYVIQEALATDDPLQASVEQILSASERAAQLTRALLAFSRKQVINPKPVDLSEVVRGIEKLLRRVIGEDIELSTELAGGPLVVMGDTGQLEQVLMNLATNARDAMPGGGILSIATRPFDLDESYVATHGWGTPGPHAVLSVSDTGMGMSEETRRKAFEPFFTTKEKGKGTGLGLSIVYGIVKQHGGGIDVYSEPGRGTSFKIVLPQVAAPAAGAAAPRAAAPVARGTETILLAEDEAIVRTMIATVLRGSGYHVVEAVDGADALEKWAAHAPAVELLVLDVVMPKKNGRDVYDEIVAVRPGIPALFLSGYTADIIHKKGIFEGLQFLAKPLAPSELLGRVREILDAARAARA